MAVGVSFGERRPPQDLGAFDEPHVGKQHVVFPGPSQTVLVSR
jgi:hypothetical protein